MKRTATLVAGLLLVTGTVFAAPTVTATGSVEYKNQVFKTDNAILQNSTGDDSAALTATAAVKFDANNSLTATVKEGNDDTIKLEYKYDGKETDVTFDTISDKGEGKGLFQVVNVTAVNEKGNVKAQVKGSVTNDIYATTTTETVTIKDTATPPVTIGTFTQTNVKPATGQSDFALDKGADAIYLQYQVTPSVQTTFYPYATKFGVDSVFNDDGHTGELKGIAIKEVKVGNVVTVVAKDYTKSETITEAVAGVKVAFTAGAAKGLSVKAGTELDNTDEVTFYVDAEYSKTVGAFTAKVDFAMTTDETNTNIVDQAIMADVTGKVATLDVQAQVFQAAGKTTADDVMAVYGKVSTKVAGISLLGEVASKALGTADAINGVYLEAKKSFAAINGVAPTATLSFKDVDLSEKSVSATVTAKVDASIVKDGITVTPALEIASGDDTTTTATVAVKYSF